MPYRSLFCVCLSVNRWQSCRFLRCFLCESFVCALLCHVFLLFFYHCTGGKLHSIRTFFFFTLYFVCGCSHCYLFTVQVTRRGVVRFFWGGSLFFYLTMCHFVSNILTAQAYYLGISGASAHDVQWRHHSIEQRAVSSDDHKTALIERP